MDRALDTALDDLIKRCEATMAKRAFHKDPPKEETPPEQTQAPKRTSLPKLSAEDIAQLEALYKAGK